jgi:dienelactone hydrolase
MILKKILSMGLLLLTITAGCATSQTAQRSVSVVTGDQIKLDFDYYPPLLPNSPTVILLPDTRCDRKNFGSFPARLNEAGFGVLAMDFRYKDLIARSVNMAQQIQTIQRQNLDLLVDQDVKSAIDFLSQQSGVDLKRVCAIGTSLGSRVALKSGVIYRFKALVLISLSGQEVFAAGSGSIQQLLSEYGDKPILFMTSEKDWGNNYRAAQDNKLYINWAKGKSDLKIWPGSGHGVDILRLSEASQFLLSWLRQNVLETRDTSHILGIPPLAEFSRQFPKEGTGHLSSGNCLNFLDLIFHSSRAIDCGETRRYGR